MFDLFPLVCAGCGRKPSEIDEYVTAARVQRCSPDAYVRCEEGTFNSETGHFLCTKCYIEAGLPATRHGWIAP